MRNIWWKVTDAGKWWRDEIKAQKNACTLDQCYAYPTKCSREKVYFVEIKIFRTFMVVLCGGHPHLTGQKFANSTVKEMLKWTLRVNKELLLDRRQSRKAKTIIYHNIDNRSNGPLILNSLYCLYYLYHLLALVLSKLRSWWRSRGSGSHPTSPNYKIQM